MRRLAATLALLMLHGTPVLAADEPASIPPDLRADVERAEARGAQLFRHDQAAWHSSDALRETGAKFPGKGRGWLTRERADGIEVRYFAEVDGAPVAFAQAIVVGDKAEGMQLLQPHEAASPEELQLLNARDAAVRREALRCSRSINTVVLPGADAIDVYVMSAWEGESFVMGGHQRVRMSTDGGRVLEAYEHTRGCLPTGGPPEGFEPMAVAMVTHLTSPTPNEFHVFLSLQHKLEIYVGTTESGWLWSVKDGRIEAVSKKDAAP